MALNIPSNKRIYLDVCALCRPFDDQRRMRMALATQVINLPRPPRLDSVERHRQWQDSVNEEQFLAQVFSLSANT